MALGDGWKARGTRWRNRAAARSAGRSSVATRLLRRPEPHLIGSHARGRQMTAGNFLFAGYLVEARDVSIWDLPDPTPEFTAELHGFGWLDDLAAAGDAEARRRARDWSLDWLSRFGDGRGPGWTPRLTGRRLLRMINHADLVLDGAAPERVAAALGSQTLFLARRWNATSPGLARFEALAGLVHGALSLEGFERHAEAAHKALARECGGQIDTRGGIATRNPEALLEVFTLLTWCVALLKEAHHAPGTALLSALERVAPTLRALRHSDGALARFHGGGRGGEGRLDQALSRPASGPGRPTASRRWGSRGCTMVEPASSRTPRPRHGARHRRWRTPPRWDSR